MSLIKLVVKLNDELNQILEETLEDFTSLPLMFCHNKLERFQPGVIFGYDSAGFSLTHKCYTGHLKAGLH